MALRSTAQNIEVLATGSGKLRATRQLAEVLAAGSGTLRATRQCVEVLAAVPVTAIEVAGTDSLSMGEMANRIFMTTDTLDLGESAVVIVLRIAIDTLTFTEAATVTAEILRFSVDTLSLTEAANRIFAASDTLDLSDAAVRVVIKSSVDILILMETATLEVPRFTVDTLSLTENADRDAMEFLRSVVEEITLGESIDLGLVKICKKNELISLLDTATFDLIKLAVDTLVLTEHAVVDRVLVCIDTLGLTEGTTVEMVWVRSVTESLSLTEQAGVNKEVLRDAADTLIITEADVADYCKVGIDDISLTDEADAIVVKWGADVISLTEDAGRAGSEYGRKKIETLSLSDSATGVKQKDKSASDTLSLSELASGVRQVDESVTEGLSLTEAAVAVNVRSASDTLSLWETPGYTINRQFANDDLIGLAEVAEVGFIRYRSAVDNVALNLTEKAYPGFRRLVASDVLQVVHIDYDPLTYEEIITYEGLQDSATYYLIPALPRPAVDAISFGEQAVCIKINHDAIAKAAADTLTMSDAAYLVTIGTAVDVLAPTDAAEVIRSSLFEDDLELTDEATTTVVRNSLGASDTLTLGEAVLWYNVLDDYLWVYHPFVGAGPATNPEPPEEELEGPIPGIVDPFKLVFPSVGPFTDTLVLRAPNLGNKDRLQMNRVSRETRGGTLVVFADPIWPKVQTLMLNFSGLTETEASGLHTFMDTHLGMEIGVLDWEHRYWKGVITKLDDPIVQDGSGCKYSVGFEFEGEMATYSP